MKSLSRICDLRSLLTSLRSDVIHRLRRWKHTPEDREDLAQVTLSAAERHLDTYDPLRGELKAWLLACADHASLRHKKTQDRHRRVILPDWGDTERAHAPGMSPEEETASEEALDIILEELRDMDPRMLTVLLAHDFEGLTLKEIAEEEGIPEPTAHSRLRRARRQARERLAPRRHELLALFPAFGVLFSTDAYAAEFLAALRDVPRAALDWLTRHRAASEIAHFAGSVLVGGGIAAGLILLEPPRRSPIHAWRAQYDVRITANQALAPFGINMGPGCPTPPAEVEPPCPPCPPCPPETLTSAPPAPAPARAPARPAGLSQKASTALDNFPTDRQRDTRADGR